MDERLDRVVSLPRESGLAEERMLRGDLVREIVARKERAKGSSGSRANSGWIAKRCGAGSDWAVGSRVGRALGGGPSISSPTLLHGAGLK